MRIIRFLSICLFMILCFSCNRNNTTISINSENFEKIEILTGHDITFDTIPGIVGRIVPVDSLYLCYLFQSRHFLMATDKNFNIVDFIARNGAGPNEVSAISLLFGNILNDFELGIFDPYKRIAYGCKSGDLCNMSIALNLSKANNVPSPLYLRQLNNGKFLMAPLEYEYSLYTYDSYTDEIDYWPTGMVFPDYKKYDITSGRGLAYNPKNHIVAEYYSVLPILILHNEDGSIANILQYMEMPGFETINSESPTLIEDVALTDNCIFALLGDSGSTDDSNTRQIISVTDYNGKPIACFYIEQANTFSVDTDKRRIIAVNPNSDTNIVIYEIPEWIRL